MFYGLGVPGFGGRELGSRREVDRPAVPVTRDGRSFCAPTEFGAMRISWIREL